MHMNKEAQILYFNRMNNLHLQMAEPPEEQAAMQHYLVCGTEDCQRNGQFNAMIVIYHCVNIAETNI